MSDLVVIGFAVLVTWIVRLVMLWQRDAFIKESNR